MQRALTSICGFSFLLSVCTSKKEAEHKPEIVESTQIEEQPFIFEEDDFDLGTNEVIISPSQMGEQPTRPVVVEQKEMLPTCLEQDENLEIYVEMSEKVFRCNGGRWWQKKFRDAVDPI